MDLDMAGRDEKLTSIRTLLDEEFISLELLAHIAYLHITETRRLVGSEEAVAETAHLVAIALSTVAPIYLTTASGTGAVRLTALEVEDLLFRPLTTKGQRPDLDNLKLRRRDVRTGMQTLKASRIAFWKKQ
jgi:hypothetical protein